MTSFMDYVEEVVLKSAKLPIKACYTISEVRKMFACSRSTIYRMADRGAFTLSPDKRIYLQEIKLFFEKHALHRVIPCAIKSPDV